MALVTNNIGTGQTYTTIASWEAAYSGYSSGDIWHGVLTDAVNYNEQVVITSTGTPSSTAYIWLDVDSSVRHDGIDGAGARIDITTPSNGRLIYIQDDWVRISGLELALRGTDTSDEAIRVGAQGNTIDDVLIEDCLIHSPQGAGDQDGIYFTDGDYTASISNCIIVGFRRGGVHYQNYTSSTRTGTINIDHCSFYDNGLDTGAGSQIYAEVDGSSSNVTFNIYNTVATDAANGTVTPLSALNVAGTLTWNGSHNLLETATPDAGTNNLTNTVTMTNGIIDTTQSSGAYWVVEDATTAPYDLRLLDDAAGNAAIDAATNRQGSEPDTRQDFGTDAKGDTRPTTNVDIGAFEYITTSNIVSGQTATTTGTPQSGNVDFTKVGGSDTVSNTASAGTIDSTNGVIGSAASVTTAANAGSLFSSVIVGSNATVTTTAAEGAPSGGDGLIEGAKVFVVNSSFPGLALGGAIPKRYSFNEWGDFIVDDTDEWGEQYFGSQTSHTSEFGDFAKPAEETVIGGQDTVDNRSSTGNVLLGEGTVVGVTVGVTNTANAGEATVQTLVIGSSAGTTMLPKSTNPVWGGKSATETTVASAGFIILPRFLIAVGGLAPVITTPNSGTAQVQDTAGERARMYDNAVAGTAVGGAIVRRVALDFELTLV